MVCVCVVFAHGGCVLFFMNMMNDVANDVANDVVVMVF